jgi:hypothetical protein
MAVDLEEQKKRVEQQKKKIKLKELLIREKERQRKAKRISEIVSLAFKARIDQIEDEALFGAFVEIAEKIQNPQIIDEWKQKGQICLDAQKTKDAPDTLLAISFRSDPGKDIKETLKKLKFRWNAFRKEFCGYGNSKKIENLLKGLHFTIEIIE